MPTLNTDLMPRASVAVPAALLRSPKLSATAKALYSLLLTYAVENPVEWPGQKQLCGQMGVTDNTLRRALRELQTLRLVTMTRGGNGQTASYHVRQGKGT